MSFRIIKKLKLGEICEIGSSKRIFASDYTVNGIPFYRSKEIIQKARDEEITDLLYISEEKFAEVDEKFGSPQNGDILLASIGANMGIPYYVNSNEKFYFKDGNVTWFKNFSKGTDSRYVYYWLTSRETQDKLNNVAIGSAQKALTIDSLRKLEIGLPNIEYQKFLSRTLSYLDKKININNRMNKVLEQMAQAIFKQWFVDYEFPNENGDPYKSSGGEMEWCEELGKEVPKGWEIGGLKEIVEIINNTINPQKFSDTLFEHYSLPAFDQNRLPVFDYGFEIKSNKFVVDSECILISKLNPTTKRIWKPYCKTGNTICSTEFMVYKSRKKEQLDYCFSLLNSNSFFEYLTQHVTGSTGSRQRVSPKSTLDYPILLMPDQIINKYVEVTKPIFRKIQTNFIINENASKFRDTLLPKLMSGEIDVSKIEL